MAAIMYPTVGGCMELPPWAVAALETAAESYHGPNIIAWLKQRGKALSEWEEFNAAAKENGVWDEIMKSKAAEQEGHTNQ
jgi:hypothetical protein